MSSSSYIEEDTWTCPSTCSECYDGFKIIPVILPPVSFITSTDQTENNQTEYDLRNNLLKIQQERSLVEKTIHELINTHEDLHQTLVSLETRIREINGQVIQFIQSVTDPSQPILPSRSRESSINDDCSWTKLKTTSPFYKRRMISKDIHNINIQIKEQKRLLSQLKQKEKKLRKQIG